MTKLLSTSQAVYIGLASMLGAGVFVVFGPASNFAGSLLPIAVILAALVAYLNAMSMAQLASQVTRSGGAYAYARQYLSPTAGFLAGAAFLVGKLGSVAAIALTFATYLTPDSKALTASAAIVVMTLINIWGINRTALGSKILGSITLGFLLVVIFAAVLTQAPAQTMSEPGSALGLFTAASLFFFAFAGYARVATLGGEVADAKVSVPRAIRVSLAIVVAVYLALALVLPLRLGDLITTSETAIADLVAVSLPGVDGAAVWVFASIAALGSLLALLAGMGRTAATMAEDGELPHGLSKRNSKGTPFIAEWLIATTGIVLALTESFVFVIGLSSFAVLTYYAIANLAAYRQPASETKRPKWLNLAGLVGSGLLALSVPLQSLLLGVSVLAVLMFLRWGLAKLA